MRLRGREDEKNKNKKGIKNNKEKIFKWSCKKNRSFDIECIIKWDVKCYKVSFWVVKWQQVKQNRGILTLYFG